MYAMGALVILFPAIMSTLIRRKFGSESEWADGSVPRQI